tara:strand:- start:30 stop:299 length:270 start_codon:yes stop_codon:yes gene_type:complete
VHKKAPRLIHHLTFFSSQRGRGDRKNSSGRFVVEFITFDERRSGFCISFQQQALVAGGDQELVVPEAAGAVGKAKNLVVGGCYLGKHQM